MKRCVRCRLNLNTDRFSVRDKVSGALRSICKACEAERLKNRIVEARAHVLQYLQQHPCVDCGEADVRVLEFDHVRGEKKMNISDMISKRMSLRTIQEEIDKCEVRCANDHRRITFDRAGGGYRVV